MRASHLTSPVFFRSGDGQPKNWNAALLPNQKILVATNAMTGVFQFEVSMGHTFVA